MWKAIKQRNLQEKVAAKDLVCYINAWWINRDGISCTINGNNYPMNQNLPKIDLVVTDIFINNGYLSKAYLFYPILFHGIICRCIIPAGTKYYINENQEIISETLYISESLGEIQAPRKKLPKTKFEDLLSEDKNCLFLEYRLIPLILGFNLNFWSNTNSPHFQSFENKAS